MKHTYILSGVLAVIVAVIFGLAIWQRENMNSLSGMMPLALSANDHVAGNNNGKAILMEYGDFQCPGCASYWPLLKQLKAEFGDDLTLVFRHFPLRNIHSNANIAAQAAEAAGLQGKFWEMADKLYSEQNRWSREGDPIGIFEIYARELGLEVSKLKDDLSSAEVKSKIEINYKEAESLNLPGTPSFFLNGRYINNPSSYGQFKELIQKELAQ